MQVFSLLLKVFVEGEALITLDSMFHTVGTATAKERAP